MGKVCLSLSASRSSIALVSSIIKRLYFIALRSGPGLRSVVVLQVDGAVQISLDEK